VVYGGGIGSDRMQTVRLVYRKRSTILRRKPAPSVLGSANIVDAYFPGRGLPSSLIVHGLLFCAVLFIKSAPVDYRQSHLPQRAAVIHREEPRIVMFLPILKDGSLGLKFPGVKLKANPRQSMPAPAPRPKGLSYPGFQEIISDPPDPTNEIQTVLQPALKSPPILAPPLSLPNIVQTADAGSELPPESPKSKDASINQPKEAKPAEAAPVKPPEPAKPVEPLPKPPEPVKPVDLPPPAAEPEIKFDMPMLPRINATPPVSIDIPKLVLPPLPEPKPEPKMEEPPPKKETPAQENPPVKPASPPQKTKPPETARPTATPPKTETPAKKAEKSPDKPEPQATVSPRDKGSGRQDLLALTPTPAPAQQPIKVPYGEARGRFAISTEPSLATSETQPGSKNGTAQEKTSIENHAKEAPKAALADVPAKTAPKPATDTGAGPLPKNGGTAKAGPGSDAKRESRAGSKEPGTGAVAGSIDSSAPAKKKLFSGITIVGGSFEPGDSEDSAPVVVQARRPLQTAYGITAISTENSGGGLPSYGVFAQDQIYTVHLDMRHDEFDAMPSWTLEFAVLKNADGSDAPKNPVQMNEGLVLPFPITKERPSWPDELVAQYQGKMVVVYAIVNAEGKMEQISIKDSPDPLLNDPLVRALRKWVFRPAKVQGNPASMKCLIGIPLYLTD
jgi:TonB family protein